MLSLRACTTTAADGDAARRRCAVDLLSVLLGERDAVPLERALALEACVHRLSAPPAPSAVGRLVARVATARDGRKALQRALGRARLRCPDVEGAAAARCSLCRDRSVRRFADVRVQRHFAGLFRAAAAEAPRAGLTLTLSRFDLFHAHVFSAKTRRGCACVGLLFHAREYPHGVPFVETLGYCQAGSPLPWSAELSALRNLLYVLPAARDAAPAFALLRAGEGTLLHEALLHPGVRALHTVDENDLGRPLADVNYLHHAPRLPSEYRLYVCA